MLCRMYHRPAIALLEAIRALRGLDVSITWLRLADGNRVWMLEATSGTGEVWRVKGADLSEAASILAKLLLAGREGPLSGKVNQERRSWPTGR